jgi:hypothetical protein
MIVHELKCWPEPFASILAGTKRHEIRKSDRPFAVGHTLRLREWVPAHEQPCALTMRQYERGLTKTTCDLCGRQKDEPLPGAYTGSYVRANILYLTEPGSWGLPDDLCVMTIEKVSCRDMKQEREQP